MKILVLAGGADQIALIQKLKKFGHKIILVDYFDNPPAKKVSDKHIIASTLDVDEVRRIALNEQVDLVTTACTDQALLTVARVSEELNLPCYISYKTALNVTNKRYMKEVLCKNKIPTARYIIINSYKVDLLSDFTFPLVVKPVDCNSSKGVKKVMETHVLGEVLGDALEYSRTHTAVIEEYKDGKELSVDCFVERGEVKLLSVTTSNKVRNTNSFTILQSCYPAVTEKEEKDLLEICQKIVDAFSLTNTPLLVQLIQNKDGLFVLEFSARMGGGSKYKLIEVLSGVDIMSAYVNLILGKNVSIFPAKRVNYASMNYIYCKKGIFDRVDNFNILKEQCIIEDFFLYKTKGMKIEKAETSGDRPAGFLVTSSTYEGLIDKIKTADKTIRVLDENGNDIMKHGLYINE